MKILVIEDSPRNIASARLTLADHELTICDNIQAAYDVLSDKTQSFDVVLTDLFLPLGSFEGAMSRRYENSPDNQLPAGLVFAIKAINREMPCVICTDANHHTDWICALLDLINNGLGPYPEDRKRKIVYVEARYVYLDGSWDEDTQMLVQEKDDPSVTIKDWGMAIKFSNFFPNVFPHPSIAAKNCS
ncbi:MAG: response regulator [bacterium]|nr:response regulator [bacterium]